MSADEYLTIAGRWRATVAASGLDKKLPKRELSLACAMFYAGFSACLEAEIELANLDLPDADAMRILDALQQEVKYVEASMKAIASGQEPPMPPAST